MLHAIYGNAAAIVLGTAHTTTSLQDALSATPIEGVVQKRIRKIIFVLHSHRAGGAERHLLDLMSVLSSAGLDCIYAGPLDGWLGRQLSAHGLRCVHIPYKGFFDVPSLIRLSWLIAREQPEIVHGHLTRGAFYSGLASRITGIPCVATAHSTNAGKWFGLADRVIAVSNAVHAFLSNDGHGRKLRTVHHGVPDLSGTADTSRSATRALLALEETPMLTMAARFTPAKGQDIALRALARITHLKWTLVLAGALDTDYALSIQQLASELGIAHRVRFAGHLDDMANVYACTDILLAPSRREALSLTLLEAASFGIPVVASNVGGIGEAVADGVTGLLLDAEDIDGLSDGISRLLEDPALRQRMGTAARQRYESMFDVSHMARATLDVYQELLESRP